MKWVKSDNGMVNIHYGDKYTYAYYKEKKGYKLLVETINVPPAQKMSTAMNVCNVKTIKQIVSVLDQL